MTRTRQAPRLITQLTSGNFAAHPFQIEEATTTTSSANRAPPLSCPPVARRCGDWSTSTWA